jgi:YgiT-type zinc finger domain-containing protein
MSMKPFKRCPICGGELEEKEVEKLLRGGRHTALLRVPAEVCLHCGERLYDEATVMRFERIRSKLKREELSEFQAMGQSFSAGTSAEAIQSDAS